MVEGISELSEGVLLGERYLLVRRLDIFSIGAGRVAGVEYEYWLAVDVASEAEVWIQFAAADGVYAAGSALAGAVAALRRINHPAVPVVYAFGEYEFEVDGAVASVGYCAFPAVAGETLAAALLREELDQAEILAALAQIAEVLELLVEFELVHGRLSAHSVLLTATEGAGYEVVLADLPASLAVETTLESELTVAADVYALAWLIVLSLIGPAVLEAEFGAGFAVTAELELLAGEVVQRRRAWAAENLVVLGVSEALAEVLLLALGEASARPRAAALTAALRAEWMLLATGAEAAAAEVVAEEVAVAEIAAEEAVAEEIVVEEVAAEEVVAGGVVASQAAESVDVAGAGKKKRSKSAAAKGAAVVAVAGTVVAAEIAEAGAAQAAEGAAGSAGTAGAGTAAGGGAAGAGEATELIPKVPQGSGPSSGAGAGAGAGGRAGAGTAGQTGAGGRTGAGTAGRAGGGARSGGRAGAAGGAGAAAAGVAVGAAAASGYGRKGSTSGSAAASNSGGFGGARGGSGGASGSGGGAATGQQQGARPKPKPKAGVLVGAGLGIVIVIALIIVFATGPSGKSNVASSGSIGTKTATASTTGAAGAGASQSAATSGAGSSASASSGATSVSSVAATSGGSGSTAGSTSASGSETFPSTLVTVPASPSQALQEIQTVVNQAKGELTSKQQSQLSQVISTLKQEITSGQSLATGMSQFWALLHSNELPSSLNTYLSQFAMYLSASQGS